MGIEPTSSAWKAEVLPLNYTRADGAFCRPRFGSPSASGGGGGRIRTFEGVSRQIYSLLPLAAWVPLRESEPRILIPGRGVVNESGATFARFRTPGGPFHPWRHPKSRLWVAR